MENDSDVSLYRSARSGDTLAFSQLYERYKKRVFGFVRTYLPRQQDAEDAFHDVFLLVLTSKELTFLEGNGGFEAWLFTVTRHICLNQVRGVARQRNGAELLSRNLRDEIKNGIENEKADSTDDFLDALKALRPEERNLVQLKLAGESTQQIATRLAVPQGTVKSRMHHVVRKLREVLIYGK